MKGVFHGEKYVLVYLKMLEKLIAGLPFIKPENKKAGLTAILFA